MNRNSNARSLSFIKKETGLGVGGEMLVWGVDKELRWRCYDAFFHVSNITHCYRGAYESTYDELVYKSRRIIKITKEQIFTRMGRP